ncbi:MAG: serine/threonine protein kinase, partial [Holophagales bacterium]|nr:serine/threonine protein kinase [Holophagales bacterium]
AIKTCSSHSEEIRSRFFKEAEIAGNLHHRNITTVYDFGVERELPFLIQEYLSGEDLDVKIKRRDFLPYAEKLLYLIQIARGLAYAHDKGVIHRDIKPANVRILEDGTAKIMDFGIAKLAQEQTGLTQTGMTLGTAAYLSPEQVRGDSVDSRSDVFSFGVLAYELLTFERPFQGEQISAVLYQLLHTEPKPVGEVWPAAPVEMSRLVSRCLSKDPGQRPAHGTDLLARLEEVQTSGRERSGIYGARAPTDADAPTVRLDSGKVATSGTAPSSRAPTIDPAGTGATRSLGDVELSSTAAHATEPPAPAPPVTGPSTAMSASSNHRGAILAGLVVLLLVAAAAGWWLGNRRGGEAAAEQTGAASAQGPGAQAEDVPPVGSVGSSTAGNGTPEGQTGIADDGGSTPAASGSGDAETGQGVDVEPREPVLGRLVLSAPAWTSAMAVRLGQGANRALDRELTLDLPPGTYTLTYSVVDGAYQAINSVTVRLEADAIERVSPAVARPGMLTARPFPRRPQGELFVGGELVGSSPIQRLALPPGRHVVEIRARSTTSEDSEPRNLSRLVEIGSGTETIVTFDLDAGNMRVTSKALP